NHLPLPWAVGAFHVERGKHAFMRVYDFLDTVSAQVLVPLLPAAGAQSDLILSVIPYVVETNRLIGPACRSRQGCFAAVWVATAFCPAQAASASKPRTT
ncbi:MAG: hypothetical protein ACXWVQ_12735, partial [Methyloceanibacter sp.]